VPQERLFCYKWSGLAALAFGGSSHGIDGLGNEFKGVELAVECGAPTLWMFAGIFLLLGSVYPPGMGHFH